MANVQPEKGTVPLAYSLIEATMKDKARSLVDRIWAWVARNTYGRRIGKGSPRRKVCVFSWCKIAEAIGADRSEVSRTGRWMIESKRLHITSDGKIGIQKDFDQWLPSGKGGKRPQGVSHVARARISPGKSPHSDAGNCQHSSYAREILAVQHLNLRSLTPTTPSLPALPNSQPDTVRNRAALGHPRFNPEDLQDEWNAIKDFRSRDHLRDEYNENQEIYVAKYVQKHFKLQDTP